MITTELRQQQEEALSEAIFAISYCLSFDKKLSSDWTKQSQNGCLGYPALILISSVIDTIGSFFRGSEIEISFGNGEKRRITDPSSHFYILNHEKLFNLQINHPKTIFDFYSAYRSKITHNSSLPPNNLIKNDKDDPKIFELNSKNEILMVNLFPLFEKTKEASQHFIHWLKYAQFSDDHILTKELKEKEKDISLNINIESIPIYSGSTS